MTTCESGLGKRTCKPCKQGLSGLGPLIAVLAPLLPGPTNSKPLSMYTCSWWKKAGDSAQLEFVQRIRSFNAGQIRNNKKAVAYGTTFEDNAAKQLVDNRCTSGYASGFALYKIYEAAAAFPPLAPDPRPLPGSARWC